MVIWYLSTLTYPSTLANRLQVMKMAESFSRYADVLLWVYAMHAPKDTILSAYGIRNDLAIRELPKTWAMRLWPRSLFRAFAFRSTVQRAPEGTVFYVRDVLFAFFLTFFSRRFRDAFVFECHSLGKMPHMVYRRVFRNARGIVSTNEAKRGVIIHRYGIPKERTLTAYNGFDATQFHALPGRQEARSTLGLPKAKRIALYAGSMQPWKGVGLIAEIAPFFPDVLFIVLGAAKEKKEANYWELSSVPSRDVPLYLSAADVLLAPYRHDTDRARLYFSPIKVMEYLASGTPVIATDLDAIREFAGEETAFLVPRGAAEAFRDVLAYVLEHPDIAARRAESGKALAASYSWERRGERIISFLKKVA